MTDSTTRHDALVATAADYLYPLLAATEDIERFADAARLEMRSAAAEAVGLCVERLDDELFARLSAGWEVRGRPARTVVTLAGEATYRRRLYRDPDGNARYLADEIIGVRPRRRLSADAFVWLARRAAAVSFRDAAADFEGLTGAAVSAMTAWRCVQEEAGLIRAELARSRPDGGVSQADVYVECDGVFVALQTPERRREAVSRFLYEQSRSRRSLELKCGCVYAGKRDAGPGRRERGNVALFATSGGSAEFWDGMRATVEADYEVADIETMHASSDGGRWCRSLPIADMAGEVVQGLDAYHLMRAATEAFPPGDARDQVVSLLLRRRPEAACELCSRVLPQIPDEGRRGKVEALRSYVAGNADLVRAGGSLGTMEGTNAKVWAARMKSRGMSWSRAGAGAMALVLSRVCAGRPLVRPAPGQWLTPAEAARRDASLARRGAEAAAQLTAGSGREYPHAQQTWSLPAGKRFRARGGKPLLG